MLEFSSKSTLARRLGPRLAATTLSATWPVRELALFRASSGRASREKAPLRRRHVVAEGASGQLGRKGGSEEGRLASAVADTAPDDGSTTGPNPSVCYVVDGPKPAPDNWRYRPAKCSPTVALPAGTSGMQSDDRLDTFWGGLGVRIPLQAPAKPWYDWLRALVTEP